MAALRTPAGRAIAAACAVVAVSAIVAHLGVAQVGQALRTSASRFPLVLLLEVCILSCTMMALRSLYGAEAGKVPASQLLRAGLVGYAVMGLLPAGRAVAEVSRAAMLSRFVGPRLAAAAALRMQGVALLANAATSVLCAAALLSALGPSSLLTLAIAGNFVVTAALGSAALLLGGNARVARWIGRQVAPDQLDDAQASRGLPLSAIGWEFTGRMVQVAQNAVLVVAVGGALGLTPALGSEAVHLVGVAVGELVPAQLGFTEANYTLSAAALGLPAASAVAIALLAHLAQLCWVVVGSIVAALWPVPPAVPAAAVTAP